MGKRKKGQHGGSRPNAGRKPLGSEPMVRRTVRAELDQWDRWKAAAEVAGKSLNEFLRDAADSSADELLNDSGE